MSLAISSGSLFGNSLANSSFSSPRKSSVLTQSNQTAQYEPASYSPPAQAVQPAPTPKPLVKIRFNTDNVQYEQPLYVAVNEALQRYPDARFELVAVHPNAGNAAQVAIQSTKSKRQAERVLRSLSQMGLDIDKIQLSYAPENSARSTEVHLYVF